MSVLIVIVNVLRTGDNANTNPGTNKNLVHSTRYKEILIDKEILIAKCIAMTCLVKYIFSSRYPFWNLVHFLSGETENWMYFCVVNILLSFGALMFSFKNLDHFSYFHDFIKEGGSQY